MCGIALLYNGNSDHHLNGMLDAMAHRGQDQVFVYSATTCEVGFRRLAITSRNAMQPGISGSWQVFLNGEIYNYKELGFSGSECDVLAMGFEKYGTDFVKRLNGMFFIVAINGDDVYVFRDRYGIKPVYYWQNRDEIVVASEIKAIVKHEDYKFAVNESARRQWMVFNNVFTDETLFDGIFKLEKGTCWHLNKNYKTKYWRWQFDPQPMNYKLSVEIIRELVFQAICRQKPQEVAYGTCLSGGIDSNIIAYTCKDIHSFTAGFKGVEDERLLAQLSPGRHYDIVFDKVRDFEKTIYHLEDLRVGASWSNYGLCELASKYVKVLFDGAGADELFGGYSWRYAAPDYYSVLNRTGIDDEYCRELINVMFPVDTLENRFLFDAEYFLEGVLIVGDKMSMSHTIEMRVPFLDNDLVDFCLHLPNEYKKNKQILKDAFSDLLPYPILHAPKKGFSSPDWIPGLGNQAQKWATAAYTEWLNQFAR